MHAIIIYAFPATCSENVDRNKVLYAAVTAHIEAIPKGDMVVTLLDANATVTPDVDSDHPVKRVLYGPNRVTTNRNSIVFREFLDDSDNFPLNCRFRQPRYATYWGPNGRTAQLDYVLVRGKWLTCFSDAFVHPFGSISFDHALSCSFPLITSLT
jgi:hypothetical protein